MPKNSASAGPVPKSGEGYTTQKRTRYTASGGDALAGRSAPFNAGKKKPNDVMPGEKGSYPVNNYKDKAKTGLRHVGP